MGKKVGAINFNKAIEKLLLEYGEEVNTVLDKSVETVAEAAADKLRGHRKFNPRRSPSGVYADSWAAEKTLKGRIYTRWVVRNVSHYRLTHVLEKGHVTRNQVGAFGKTPAYPHIKDVDQWVQKALPEEVVWRLGK